MKGFYRNVLLKWSAVILMSITVTLISITAAGCNSVQRAGEGGNGGVEGGSVAGEKDIGEEVEGEAVEGEIVADAAVSGENSPAETASAKDSSTAGSGPEHFVSV